MLHVDPSALKPAVVAFDPYVYLDQARRWGMRVHASFGAEGARRLEWDIGEMSDDGDPEPRADINADPANSLAVWEVLRAEAWIAAARECGLVVLPWHGITPTEHCILQYGQDDDENDFSAGTDRLLKHPDRGARKECSDGVVYRTLCHEIGVDPDDLDLCTKVNAWVRQQAGAAS